MTLPISPTAVPPAPRPDYRTPPAGPWYQRPVLTLLVLAGLVAAFVAVRAAWDKATNTAFAATPAAAAGLADDDPPAKDAPPRDAPKGAAPKSAAAGRYEARLRLAEDLAAETQLKQRLAAAKAAQKVVAELGAEAARTLDEAAAELDRWDAEVPPLLTNDAGRAVASKPDAARAFRALYDLERPGRADVVRLRGQVELLLAPADQAYKNPNDAWDKTADAEKRLTALLAQAKATRDAVRTARTRIDSLVTVSKRDGKPGTATLQEAIHVFVHEEALEAAALITAERTKARKETDRVMAETLGEADRRAGQTAAKREAAKAEAARLREEEEADNQTRQAAKDKLRVKARSPEVQQALAVFLARGYSQPRQGGSGFFDRTAEHAPVSFTRLQTGGYLDESPDGLKKLLRLGAEPNQHNDRPKWRFNAFRLDQHNEAFLKNVQGLLRELGPVLVEEGLLAK